MKEVIVAIIGSIKDILTLNLRHILVIAFFVAAFAYSLLVLPQCVFDALNIGNLRSNNLDVIGAIAYTASFIFVVGLLYQSAVWVCSKLSERSKKNRERRQVQDVFDSLDHNELLYLHQFIRNRTTLIEFDETNPVVALLREKGVIYPVLGRVRNGPIPSYNCTYTTGQPFEIPATVYDYLAKHPELFDRLLGLKPQSHPLYTRLQFLDSVEDYSTIEDLRKKASELVDFVKSLKRGAIYAKRIEELVCQPDDVHLTQSDDSMSEHEYLLAKDQLVQKYRKRLRDAREQVYSLATELLRLQPW